jgi:hypothetical protein
MPRRYGSTAGDGSFGEAIVEMVWRMGRPEPNFTGIRRDGCGALIHRSEYGKETLWGWEIDHIRPVAQGGADDVNNLQALQWENNHHKGDTWPWTPSAGTCKRTH